MTLLEKNLNIINNKVKDLKHMSQLIKGDNVLPSVNGLLLELNSTKNSIINNTVWVDKNNNNLIYLTGASTDTDNTLLFNGTSTYFNTGIYQSALVNGYTIAVRFKPTQWSNYKGLWGDHSSYGTGLVGFQHEDTVFSLSHITSGMTAENVIQIPATEFPINNWYTIILTYSTTDYTRLFYNDKVKEDIQFMPLDAYSQLCIGRAYNNSDRYFKGNMSHVIIYNRALNKSEVQDLYNYINKI